MIQIKRLCCVLLGLALTSPALAQRAIVVPPDDIVKAGTQVTVSVLFREVGGECQPSDRLSAVVMFGEGKTETILKKRVADVIESRAIIHKQQYILTVPDQVADDTLSISIPACNTPPAYLFAYQEEVPENLPDLYDDDRRNNDFLSKITAYQPTYFIAGADAEDAKFQISFKYQFIDVGGSEDGKEPENQWLENFYFGYTQLSIWDLTAESFPFEDTNFLPEVFYQSRNIKLPFLGDGNHLDFQVGVQHESNGQAGDDSRNLNIAYLEPALHFDLGARYELTLAPRVWTYFGNLTDNPDIDDFRGNASLRATLYRRQGWQLEAYLRGNPGTGNGSMQFDFTYPLTRLSNDTLSFYLHTQLFHGFGESLLDFDQKDTRFRVGLGIVR